MTENMALAIERKDDPGVLDFYIERCLREAYPIRYKRETCDVQVKSRARAILLQAASVILNTYASLESLMRTSTLCPDESSSSLSRMVFCLIPDHETPTRATS